MEDVLNKARRAELKITPDVMDVVLESIDMMKALLAGIKDHGNDTDVGINIEDICKRLTAISEGEEAPASEAPAAEAPATPAPEAAPAAPAEEKKEAPAPEPEEPEVDVNSLSDQEVEDEIQRLLTKRKDTSGNSLILW